jgi:ATPase subunit of ABC transporter with duplicated ATPase domains
LRTTYKVLPYKAVEDVQTLSNDKLEISLFGRTMAEKSTLMSILTHGDGSQMSLRGNLRIQTTNASNRYSQKETASNPGWRK